VTGERFIRVDLPPTITAEHIEMMQRDLEMMAEIAQQYPKDMTELHHAVVRHDFHRAMQVARRVGLTEEQFAARGGGQVGVAAQILVVLVVASLIMSGGSGEGEAPTPAQPTVGLDGGLPPGGVSDAGAPGG
jgi:hypothetical protein